MDYVLRPEDRALFTRCRRAWDLGARVRQNYEPLDPPSRVDLDRAVHDALAVYYFPGMWDWSPPVVLPLVRQAFRRSMDAQRRALPTEEEPAWAAAVALGERLLEAYFGWAPGVDRFAPIRIDTDLEVTVPDPNDPERGLLTAAGERVRYQCRLDLLVIDEQELYWVVVHRLVSGDWADDEQLLLDERAVAWAWAWEQSYPGMRIAGTVHNELRVDVEPKRRAAPATARSEVSQHRRIYQEPTDAHPRGPRLLQGGEGPFRRTRIERRREELASFGDRLARQVQEMAAPTVAVYPTPSRHACARCDYRQPCISMNDGGDLPLVLASWYRKRPPEVPEEGRLGGQTWSTGRGAAPPRFGPRRPDEP